MLNRLADDGLRRLAKDTLDGTVGQQNALLGIGEQQGVSDGLEHRAEQVVLMLDVAQVLVLRRHVGEQQQVADAVAVGIADRGGVAAQDTPLLAELRSRASLR